AGPRLVLGKGDRLTPLARDRAKELGVELVLGDGGSAASSPTPAAILRGSSPSKAPVAPAAAAASPASTNGSPVEPQKPPAPPRGGKAFTLPPSGAMYRRHALAPT